MHPSRSAVSPRLALLTVLLGALLTATPDSRADYLLGDYFFILTTDYEFTGGNFSLMDMHPPWEHDNNMGALYSDAIARYYDGHIYLVNRFGGDNIQVLDPDAGFSTVLQFSTGALSNPQDICFLDGNRAYVTRYDSADLWEVDPTSGEHTGTVDLSPLADGDGLPEMQGMALYGNHLYVTVQRLDRDNYWMPDPPSYLAVIDTDTNQLLDMDPVTAGVQGLALLGTNPNSGILVDPLLGHFLVGQLGTYGVADGGIERIDPPTQQSLGWVITESTLGGDLDIWTTGDGFRGFAIALSPTWASSIVAFDLSSGANLGIVATSDEYAYPHLQVDPPRRQLFVADFSYSNPGIRVFDSGDLGEQTSGPIPVGLYPRWLLPMHGIDSGPDLRPRSMGQTILAVWPQPAAGALNLSIESQLRDPVDLEILDPEGRCVAGLLRSARAPEGFELRWDGRGKNGRRLTQGTYLARLRTGGIQITRKIHLMY